MIVECTNCDTRFQLDDARVPLRGIRVRCSRCKEAFFLEHPDANKQDVANDIAEQAASGAPPDSTQDLARAPHDRPASAEPDEEDWEFNADIPDEDPNEASATDFGTETDALGDLASDEAEDDAYDEPPEDHHSGTIPGLGVEDMSVDEDDFSSGLDLADDSATRVRAAASVEPDESEIDEADVDDALADLGADDGGSDFGEATDFSALADEPAAAPPVAPAAAPVASAPAQDGGEEADDWDFFSDESGEQPALGAMDSAMGRVMEAVEDPTRMQRPGREPEMGMADERAGGGLAGVASAGRTIGWIVTCCLFGLGLARGIFDVAAPGAHTLTSVDLGPLSAQQVRGTWYETARGTQLYAVTGQLVNDSDAARMPGRALEVKLTARGDVPLEVPGAPAGSLIAEVDLRELSADRLEMLRQQRVEELAWTRLEPGQGLPFLAFFDGIPAEATGFVLEMASTPAPLAPQPPALPDAEALDAPGALEDWEAAGEAPAEPAAEMPVDPGAGPTTPSSAVPAPASPQPLPR